MSNFCAKSNASIIYKNANFGVISFRVDASFYIINFSALYAKAPKLNLQAFVYK